MRSLRSSLGPQLDRLERLSCDSDGKKIPKIDPQARVMLVRETPNYYDNASAGDEDLEAHADGSWRFKMAQLTDEELRCAKLHQARGQELESLLTREQLNLVIGRKWARTREVAIDVTREEEEARVAEGWHLSCRHGRNEQWSRLVKNFPTCLGYEQIAEVTGLSVSTVRRRCLSAYEKLR